jgi:MFS family permease
MGTAITLTTNQFAQVIGFAAGGAIDGFLGTGRALVIDAATFACSAAIVRVWVRARPAAGLRARPGASRASGLTDGLRLVFGHPVMRTSMLFGWLAAFYNVPEGVVTPLAKSLHGGAAVVGVILAAQALGETIGAVIFSRFVSPSTRLRLMGPLAVGCCAVLVFFAASPTLAVALILLGISGLCASYQLAANAAFVSATPHGQRSQAFGIAQGGISLGQGAIMVLAGAAAQHFACALVIAWCAAIGVVLALPISVRWARDRRP